MKELVGQWEARTLNLVFVRIMAHGAGTQPGYQLAVWASLSMRRLIRGRRGVAEVSQMTPPPKEGLPSLLSPEPQGELPPAPFPWSAIHGCPHGNCDGDPVGGIREG